MNALKIRDLNLEEISIIVGGTTATSNHPSGRPAPSVNNITCPPGYSPSGNITISQNTGGTAGIGPGGVTVGVNGTTTTYTCAPNSSSSSSSSSGSSSSAGGSSSSSSSSSSNSSSGGDGK